MSVYVVDMLQLYCGFSPLMSKSAINPRLLRIFSLIKIRRFFSNELLDLLWKIHIFFFPCESASRDQSGKYYRVRDLEGLGPDLH